MSVFAPLLLVAPLLLLATAVVSLARYGPLGWLVGLLLVLGCAAATWWSCRLLLSWWRSTKVAPRPQVRPAELRRLPRP